MARQEQDREDLLAEGRNLPHRGEFVIDGIPLVVGFRSGGQLSLFCGSDPVFQFDARHRLRRAYVGGQKLVAERGRLLRMVRVADTRMQFDRVALTEDEVAEIRQSLTGCLAQLRRASEGAPDQWRTIGIEPPELLRRLARWLESVPGSLPIADAPNA